MLGLNARLVNFGQYAKFGECSIINPVLSILRVVNLPKFAVFNWSL